MLHIAICDDEDKIINELALYIGAYSKEAAIEIELDCYTDPFELLAKSDLYELFFLDIDMPKMNGLDVGQKIKEKNSNPEIIYVTAYSDYAYRSFSVRPFGYIVKPFSKTDIFKELTDYTNKMEAKNNVNIIQFHDRFVVVSLKVDDIIYFEHMSNKHVSIVTEDKKYSMSKSLKYFYEKVRGYGFTYPHQSFVVNMLHIEKIKQFELTMKSGIILPIAQKKKPQFMEEYNRFLQNILGLGR